MSPEAELRAALAGGIAAGRIWWRDDDAGRDHPRLAQLLALAARHTAPVALAVVPAWLDAACRDRIGGCALATVLQHGIAHANHAEQPAKKIELGGSASGDGLRQGLRDGLRRLAGAFGAACAPVLVPPWNRIDAALLPELPGLGYHALSTFGPRRPSEAVPGLRRLDTHLDLVAWREGARPLAFEEAALRLAALIRSRRPHGPIGILSHHLVMDEAAFGALDRLVAVLQDRPESNLVGIGTLLEGA